MSEILKVIWRRAIDLPWKTQNWLSIRCIRPKLPQWPRTRQSFPQLLQPECSDSEYVCFQGQPPVHTETFIKVYDKNKHLEPPITSDELETSITSYCRWSSDDVTWGNRDWSWHTQDWQWAGRVWHTLNKQWEHRPKEIKQHQVVFITHGYVNFWFPLLRFFLSALIKHLIHLVIAQINKFVSV